MGEDDGDGGRDAGAEVGTALVGVDTGGGAGVGGSAGAGLGGGKRGKGGEEMLVSCRVDLWLEWANEVVSATWEET